MGKKVEKVDNVPFEEALSMTGFGRYNLVMTLLIHTIIIAMAAETFSVAYLVPASACELDTTSANQGVMAAVPLIGILTSSNIWGYLADTRGRKKILILAMILGFFTGCSATFSPNWIVFAFLKFLSSSSMAGSFGLSIAYLSECTPESKREILLMLITSVYLTCTGCMAAITIPILPLKFSYYIPYLDIHFNSWRLLNLIYSAPCAISAIGLYLAFESPKFLLSTGHEEQALSVLKKIYVINSGKSADEFKVNSVVLDEESGRKSSGFWSSIAGQTLPLLKPPLLKNTLLLSSLYVSIYFCINPIMVWLPYMFDGVIKAMEDGNTGLTFCDTFRSKLNLNETVPVIDDCTLNSSAMLMVFGLDLILAGLNVILSAVLAVCGQKKMLIGIQFVAGLSALCVNFSTTFALTGILIITYVSGTLNFGVLSTFSVNLFPTYVKAMSVCLTLMVGRGSAVLGINILKQLLDTNCEASFYFFGSITVCAGLVGLLLPSDKRNPTSKKTPET